jgi:type I restriction enzyme M protein
MERVPKAKQQSTAPTTDGATVGYEARLRQMADALRGSMDAAIAANLKEPGYGG